MTWATSSLRLELAVVGALGTAAEADHLAAQALADDLLEADEGSTADEEDVGGVDLDVLLLRVLSPPLWWHVGDSPFEQLEQGLLHALAGYVAGDRNVLAGLADLVDLIDVDDALLGGGDLVVGRHHELEDQVLDVLADVAGLGQGGGVADGERDVQPASQGLGQSSLAAARRADQENIALGDLDVFEVGIADLAAEHSLVMVDDRDGQSLLHPLLADDVLVQVGHELAGRRDLLEPGILPFVLLKEVVTRLDAMGAKCRAIGLPVTMGFSAAPSIIGPASALFRPQKSHRTGGCAGAELSSVVTLVTPDQRQRSVKGKQIVARAIMAGDCDFGDRVRIPTKPEDAISMGIVLIRAVRQRRGDLPSDDKKVAA